MSASDAANSMRIALAKLTSGQKLTDEEKRLLKIPVTNNETGASGCG